MKTKRFIALASALAASLALPFGGTAKASEFLAAQSQGGAAQSSLVLKVEGLETARGQLLIGLYNSENGYETREEMIGRVVPVSNDTAIIRFEQIPVGQYAIKVFHDEDNDGKLDKGAFGIPSEAYGFSNNASDPFSAPEWSETRFSLPRGQMTQTIKLS